LRGHLSDELREINYCRVRLGELLHQFEVSITVAEETAMPVIGRLVFPSGCADLGEAVQRFLGNITPELLAELDGKVEDMIRHKYTALVNICMTSANILKNVELAMLETAEQFAGSLFSETNAAEMFLEQYPDQERAAEELGEYYDQAAPELQPPRPKQASSICLVAAPPGAAGDGIRGLVHNALPDLEIHAITSNDDVVIYREVPNLPLAELPQMGALGQTAYRQMNSADNFTPHTRTDVNFGNGAG
jgi:eukaryotic-like serine/threonine-protein kinase